jgi:hypothetical protein
MGIDIITADHRSQIPSPLSELDAYTVVSLDDLVRVTLLNRVDSKYIFHFNELGALLHELSKDYSVLEIEGKKIHTYETLYFDTPDYKLYRFHHDGKLNRLKVRCRKYADSGLSFFEVKYKVKGLRTDKVRIEKADISRILGPEELNLIHHEQIKPEELVPGLWVYFKRITIVKNDYSERATIDIGLRFEKDGTEISYEDIVIAEIKQNKTSYTSPLIKALKARHFEKSGFSKYAMGLAAIEGLKSNRFKPNFIKIEKIRNGKL